MTEPAATTPEPTERPALVRIPSAILVAFVTVSIVITIWVFLIGDHVPAAVDNVIGSLLLFAAAPILTGMLLRGSRLWVRVAVALFAAWVWVFWLFIVLVPITT